MENSANRIEIGNQDGINVKKKERKRELFALEERKIT